MLATVSVKGQVTVPKLIREQLRIERGTQLDFVLNADGSILVRPMARSAQAIVGLLTKAARPARSVAEMNDAMSEAAVERHKRVMRAK